MNCKKCNLMPIFTTKSGLCARCYNYYHGRSKFEDRQKAPYGSQKGHPLVRCYRKMLDRCYSKNGTAYPNYGARGIRVSARWRGVYGFSHFASDMGVRPEGTSLDRKDNNKSYTPDNCRWSTKSEQARNRRTNRAITAFGKTQILIEWAAETGIKRETITMRLRLGWSPEKTLSAPLQIQAKKGGHI